MEALPVEDDDLDQIPFSLFTDLQSDLDDLWEWFVHCVQTAKIVTIPEVDEDWCAGYALLPWGVYSAFFEGPIIGPLTWRTWRYPWKAWRNNDDFEQEAFPVVARCETGGVLTTVRDTYIADLAAKLRGTPLYPYMTYRTDYGTTTPSACDSMYATYKSQIEHAWREMGQIRRSKTMFKHGMGSKLQQGAAEEWTTYEQEQMSRSEQTWFETPGYYMAYVDNLGVMVPVGYSLDSQMINEFRVKFPQRMYNYIIVSPIMDAGFVQAQSGLVSVPLVGQAMGAFAGGRKAQRYLLPRIRAFGRQLTLPASYSQYVEEGTNMGFSYGNPAAALVDRAWYEKMLKDLKRYYPEVGENLTEFQAAYRDVRGASVNVAVGVPGVVAAEQRDAGWQARNKARWKKGHHGDEFDKYDPNYHYPEGWTHDGRP